MRFGQGMSLQMLVSPELKSKYGAKGERRQALSVTQTNGMSGAGSLQ